MKGVFRMIDEERLQNAIREIIIALGDDPERDGLKDTPRRAAEMYIEQFEGM
ncbi:MAG: GTP cyclohydrolase I, partial [Acholeplasmatales bacterium]|nr:GTP cyclohydrolase I [Acholeplasmatales bacterium]